MPAYDVYGLGNALVDIQYSVPPAFLDANGVDKGVMTLVDAQRQAQLADALQQDPVTSASGGSAANTLIGVAQFGGSAYYACQLGRGEWGDFYHRDLEAAGVRCNPAARADEPTGMCTVLITPDADRTLNTFLGANLQFGPGQIEEEPISQSQYIYIEGYLASGDSSFEACLKAQELAQRHGVKVSLTLSDPFMVDAFKERFVQLVDRGVDLLFCNEDEAKAYTGQSDRAAALNALARVAGTACVTCGADGILLASGAATHSIAGVRVEAVDTTGAGDMFAGGYLYGVTNGYAPVQAAQLGSYAAAQVVSRFGPRLSDGLPPVADIIAHFSA